jgi:hypothetical protein
VGSGFSVFLEEEGLCASTCCACDKGNEEYAVAEKRPNFYISI